MNFEGKNLDESQNDVPRHIDMDALYLLEEKKRIKEAILKTDTDKFFLFTRMLRISLMLKKAKIIHAPL